MAVYRFQAAAERRLEGIYRYTLDQWGSEQAERYVRGLFDTIEKIDTGSVVSRPVPVAFGVEGYFFRYGRHFVYWRRLSDGAIGIVTILHERMHQIDRFREDFFDGS
jgi:plasmid stabilization system protein ParE